MVTPEQIQQLPQMHITTITEDHLDLMEHMNIRHYIGIFDDAAWHMFATFGMDNDYYRHSGSGAFALEHHIRYLAEVRLHETVAIHTRVLARTAKRVHFMHFMHNQTRDNVAATFEVVGAHADLSQRRMSPFPPAIGQRIDDLVAQHDTLSWTAPTCGVMAP